MADADTLRDAGIPAAIPPTSFEPAPGPAAPEGEKVMSLVDHLTELRTRLAWSIAAILVGSIIGFWRSTPILEILAAPLDEPLLNLGPGDAFEVAASRLDRRDGTFAATLLLRTGADAKTQIEVRGSFYRTVAMPVLARTMRSGEVIGEGDLAWIEVRAEAKDAAAISDPKDMIGRTPRRLARAGETLKPDELKAPTVVAKGALVTMVVETPSMTLTAKGRALEDGADGDTIKVQNTRSHQTVEGTVAGANRVLVALPQGAVRRTAERRR